MNQTLKTIQEGMKIMTPVVLPILNIIERWESSQLEDSEKDEIYSIIKSHILKSNKQILQAEVERLEGMKKTQSN